MVSQKVDVSIAASFIRAIDVSKISAKITSIKPALTHKYGGNRNEKLSVLFFPDYFFNCRRHRNASGKRSNEHQNKRRKNYGNKKLIV
jgi:hypothetical protein